MDYRVVHPKLVTQELVVRKAGTFGGETVILNGSEASRGAKRGAFIVKDDSGAEITVKLKQRIYDPIPNVLVGTDPVSIVKPLPVYQYILGAFPLMLIFLGGAIGGLLGGAAAYINLMVFRNEKSVAVKLIITTVISSCAIILYIFIVSAIMIGTGKMPIPK